MIWQIQRLPCGTALAEGMFKKKINGTFKEVPNVFGNADDILIVGYDGDVTDHERSLRTVL